MFYDEESMPRDDIRFAADLYSLTEAARLARLPRPTLRNWVLGYTYPSGSAVVRARPVIHARKRPEPSLSFINLMESVALSGFREVGVSMQRVRKALDYASKSMKLEHLFANQRILTDGSELFWEFEERGHLEKQLVNITREGQKAFPETVMRYLQEIEWGPDMFASRWWPGSSSLREGLVVVDPRRAFGAPVLAGTGVRTDDVFDRFFAGEPIRDLTDDYGLTREQIEAAIRLEARLREPIAA